MHEYSKGVESRKCINIHTQCILSVEWFLPLNVHRLLPRHCRQGRGFPPFPQALTILLYLKKKILPITSSSARPAGLVQIFLCTSTENVDFRGLGLIAARYLLGWVWWLGLHKKPTPDHHLIRTYFRPGSSHLPPIFVITKIQRPYMPHLTRFFAAGATFESLCNYKIR